MFKVYSDHTKEEKTSNEYSDDELINFNLVCTATSASNLSSINKNNSNDCDIIKGYEGKTVEAVLANSVPISASDKEANLHLVETIDSTIDQFKALFFFFFNWDLPHARLNSHYEAWSYKKKKQKRLQDTENLFRKNLQLKDVC